MRNALLCFALMFAALSAACDSKNNPGADPVVDENPDGEVPGDQDPDPADDSPLYSGTFTITNFAEYWLGLPPYVEAGILGEFYKPDKQYALTPWLFAEDTCQVLGYDTTLKHDAYRDVGESLSFAGTTSFNVPRWKANEFVYYEYNDDETPIPAGNYTLSWGDGPEMAAGEIKDLEMPMDVEMMSPALAETIELPETGAIPFNWEPGYADHMYIIFDTFNNLVVCKVKDDGYFVVTEQTRALMQGTYYWELSMRRVNERKLDLPDGSSIAVVLDSTIMTDAEVP